MRAPDFTQSGTYLTWIIATIDSGQRARAGAAYFERVPADQPTDMVEEERR
jgi:hypothetical protein